MSDDLQFMKQHFELNEESTVNRVAKKISQAHYDKENALRKVTTQRFAGEYPDQDDFKAAKGTAIKRFKDTINLIEEEQDFQQVAGMGKMAHALVLYRKTLKNLKRNPKHKTDIEAFIPDFKDKPELSDDLLQKYREKLVEFELADEAKKTFRSDILLLKSKMEPGTMGSLQLTDMQSWISFFLPNGGQDPGHLLRCEVSWLMTRYNIKNTTMHNNSKKKKPNSKKKKGRKGG